MPRKDKKLKHKMKRKAARKKQRARTAKQPDILRKDPVLRESLSHQHPLIGCRINEGWQEEGMASIFVVRQAPTGIVFGAFLVDLLQFGLKDAYGDCQVLESDLEEQWEGYEGQDSPMQPCDYELAHRIIHSGVQWALKNGATIPKKLMIWTRLLEPAGEGDIDLALFGDGGEPIGLETENTVIDQKKLQAPLMLDQEDLPSETLDRIGDIKAALVAFSSRAEFLEEAEEFLSEEYGDKNQPRNLQKEAGVIDRFILEHRLESGETVAEKFVDYHGLFMSNDVRRMVLSWRYVIEGLFEVRGRQGRCVEMRNLVNEKFYRAYATVPDALGNIKSGDFLLARIVPIGRQHAFSATATIYSWDGTERQRADMYRIAVDMQLKFPYLAFRDNEEKLSRSLEMVREQHAFFVNHFGGDQFVGPGVELEAKFRRFNELWNEKHAVRNAPAPPKPLFDLPKSFRHDAAAGLISDPVDGFLFLEDYGGFLDIFARPGAHLGEPDTAELLFDYLEDAAISDAPFRRVQARYPDGFKQVLAHYRRDFNADVRTVDDLMREFKPESFHKLPSTVVILDPEIRRIANGSSGND